MLNNLSTRETEINGKNTEINKLKLKENVTKLHKSVKKSVNNNPSFKPSNETESFKASINRGDLRILAKRYRRI